MRVHWYCTRGIEAHTHFPQEVMCKRVTVCCHKGPGVENHLLVNIKVVQIVKLVIIWSRERNAMAADKCSYVKREQVKHERIPHYCLYDLSFEGVTLWNATIFELWLHNLYGVVLQVEINLTFSNPVGFLSALSNIFLEICIEAKNLKKQKDVFMASAYFTKFIW